MKKIQTSIILLLIIGVVSCKKNDSATMPATANSVSSDQFATITTGSLAANSSGLTSNFDDITTALIVIKQGCGTTVTDSTTQSGSSNGATYNYLLKYTHTLTCNESNQQDNIQYDLKYNGHFDGPAMSSLDTGTSTFKIAGFTPHAQTYLINGEYKRSSAFTMKTGEKVSGTSTVDIVVTSLLITKTTRMITGGGATITVTVTVPKGKSTYSAPVTFNGDGTATVTINGTKYSINLLTGVVTAQ
jgi:hypothetical protein